MKNFDTRHIEIILIFSGVFLGTYLFCIGFMTVFKGLLIALNMD